MKIRPPISKRGGDAAKPQLRVDREAQAGAKTKIEQARKDAAARIAAASARIEAEHERLLAANFPPDLIKRDMEQITQRERQIGRQEASAIYRQALQELDVYKRAINDALVPYVDVRRQFLIHATKSEAAAHTAALLPIVDRLGPEALARFAQMVVDMSGSEDATAMQRTLPLAHAVISKLESYPSVDARPVSLSDFMDCFSWPAFDQEKARLNGLAKSITDFERDAADIMRDGQRSSLNKIAAGVSEGQHRQRPRRDGESRLDPASPTGKISAALSSDDDGSELI